MCCIVLCCGASCFCCGVLYRVMLWCVVSCYVVVCCIVLSCGVLYRVMLWCVGIVLCCGALYRVMLWCAVSCYLVVCLSCYVVVCCIGFCCGVLYRVMKNERQFSFNGLTQNLNTA